MQNNLHLSKPILGNRHSTFDFMFSFSGYGQPPGYPPSMGYPPPGGGYPRGYGGSSAPPPGADPTLWNWFVTVDRDRSGQITADELQQALLNGNWSHFNSETCRLMIGKVPFFFYIYLSY